MNFNVIKPLYRKVSSCSNTEMFFSFNNDISEKGKAPSKFNLESINQYIKPKYILPIEKTKYIKWDAVIDSDVYTPWFYRNTQFIQIFHGVAAKAVTLEDGTIVNYNYHPNLKRYDICFFTNKLFFNNAKEAGLGKKDDTGEIIGLCYLDDLIEKNNEKSIKEIKEKLVPEKFRSKKIILYAPSWGNHNSLACKGAEILRILAQMDMFTLIKPHPNSIMDDIKDMEEGLELFLSKTFKDNNFSLITSSPYEPAVISDALITDFGSLALEYALLRKPIFLFCGTDHKKYIADLKQFDMTLKCSTPVYESEPITQKTFEIPEMSEERRTAMIDLENSYFANVGHATEAAFNALLRRNIICSKKPLASILQ